MAIAGLELKVDWHVNHLHRHVGEVEGGVEEDRDGHSQEDGHGGGHQGGHHGAEIKTSTFTEGKGRKEIKRKENKRIFTWRCSSQSRPGSATLGEDFPEE